MAQYTPAMNAASEADTKPVAISISVLRQIPSAALMTLYLCLLILSPHRLERLAVEDGSVEWLTVGAFAAATAAFGAVARRTAGPARSGAALAAAFCAFIAGEEVSWGERLFGFLPPELFLRDNLQQEFSIHNFLQAYLKPKWAVVGLLGLWGAALPLLKRFRPSGRIPATALETAPPLELVPWSLAGVSVMACYPAGFSGEYIELLAGLIMMEAALCRLPRHAKSFAFTGAAALGLLGLTLTDKAAAVPEAVGCAVAETAALFKAVNEGALDGERELPDSMDKRMYRAAEEGYLRRNPLKRALAATACPGIAEQPLRDEYFIDPWGQPYRLALGVDSGGDETADIYSGGPNRRLDEGGDDIHAQGILTEEGRQVALEL